MALEVIILAAGKGSRMRSTLPKVLHHLAGEPLLAHVLKTAQSLQPKAIHVVVGHQAELVKTRFAANNIQWAEQTEQNGTGHAVAQAMPHIAAESTVLIMNGDVPLITAQMLDDLREVTSGIQLLSVKLDKPTGFGRILRDEQSGAVLGIVEEKDANDSQRQINEINTGLMAMPAAELDDWLNRISNDNAQGEYYLTDIIELAVADGKAVNTSLADDPDAVMGINSRSELAYLERVAQSKRADALMAQGVSLADPARIDLRGDVSIGLDSYIDINAVIENSQLGTGCQIGPNVTIRNSQIADQVIIEANSVIDGAEIHNSCQIGPFARLRPETHLAESTKIGNFVEIKKSHIATGTKINHLSYVGDALVGKNTNIGAGMITANYDGANKHQTVIGDNVSIGSDCQLVAPVTIGDGATVGAGTTVAKDVPAGMLTVARAKPRSIPGWQRPSKKT